MKLRNKKTGVIIEPDRVAVIKKIEQTGTSASFNRIAANYYSLAKLNEEWEDYEPKEPLIEDEKVRKAVLAWAEANGIDELTYYSSSHYWYLRASNNHDQSIDFWISYNRDPELIECKRYTIAELCGEEED